MGKIECCGVYRTLYAGEKIEAGDEYKNPDKGWVSSVMIGCTVLNIDVGNYRRPVEIKANCEGPVTLAPSGKPVTPVDPGPGYRLLNNGEKLEKGDEYHDLCYHTLRWSPTAGWTLPASKVGDNGYELTYRRKLPETSGYEFLKAGTPIQKGDQYLSSHSNRWENAWAEGVKVPETVPYRRPVAPIACTQAAKTQEAKDEALGISVEVRPGQKITITWENNHGTCKVTKA